MARKKEKVTKHESGGEEFGEFVVNLRWYTVQMMESKRKGLNIWWYQRRNRYLGYQNLTTTFQNPIGNLNGMLCRCCQSSDLGHVRS